MSTTSTLHQILLQPTDVLFFRDGRPMAGSLAGHTAGWPLPNVTNHALHAALHRAGFDGLHGHDHHRYDRTRVTDARKFGSVLTAGPFPVRIEGVSPSAVRWFFPRPKDAQLNGSVAVTMRPVRSIPHAQDDPWIGSSLPEPLAYAAANTEPPSKEAGGEPWISAAAYTKYLCSDSGSIDPATGPHFLRDSDLADIEQTIGITIEPDTGTTGHGEAAGLIYSAHYLRLREELRLGLFAEALDKIGGDPDNKRDLIALLLRDSPLRIVVGGQQRLCTAHCSEATQPLPFPKGLHAATEFLELPNRKCAVKWVLLTPALWPEIPAQKKDGSPQNSHPGGWLPNWVRLDWDAETRQSRPSEDNGRVLLTAGPGVRKSERKGGSAGSPISARLVAAIVPKPIPITGWALVVPDPRTDGSNAKSPFREAGAKSTHLAVPAGAVYYFEAESPGEAAKLARALNWHGDTDGGEIRNRRSTLLGEKGFGLGVCGTWKAYGEA